VTVITEGEAEDSLVIGQPRLHGEILSEKQTNKISSGKFLNIANPLLIFY
jgi:hypothetical protein